MLGTWLPHLPWIVLLLLTMRASNAFQTFIQVLACFKRRYFSSCLLLLSFSAGLNFSRHSLSFWFTYEHVIFFFNTVVAERRLNFSIELGWAMLCLGFWQKMSRVFLGSQDYTATLYNNNNKDPNVQASCQLHPVGPKRIHKLMCSEENIATSSRWKSWK